MISLATVVDLPRLEPCAREFYAAAPSLGEFHLERFCEVWAGLLTSGAGVVFIASEGGDVRGCLGAVRHRDLYSEKSIAVEMFWFVPVRYRGTAMAGPRLYFAFERWARAEGCEEIRMVHLLDSMPEEVRAFYQKADFIATEIHYAKKLSKVSRRAA